MVVLFAAEEYAFCRGAFNISDGVFCRAEMAFGSFGVVMR